MKTHTRFHAIPTFSLKFKHWLIPCLACLTLLATTACTANPIGNGSARVAGDPEIGTQVKGSDLADFYPTLRIGMKYVYLSTELKGEVKKSTRLEAEVVETTEQKAKLKISIGGTAPTTTEVDRDQDPPVLPSGGITFEGRENVTTPAGTFNALKYSYSQNKSAFNSWGVKGTGIIKILEQRSEGDTVTTELQSFEK